MMLCRNCKEFLCLLPCKHHWLLAKHMNTMHKHISGIIIVHMMRHCYIYCLYMFIKFLNLPTIVRDTKFFCKQLRTFHMWIADRCNFYIIYASYFRRKTMSYSSGSYNSYFKYIIHNNLYCLSISSAI